MLSIFLLRISTALFVALFFSLIKGPSFHFITTTTKAACTTSFWWPPPTILVGKDEMKVTSSRHLYCCKCPFSRCELQHSLWIVGYKFLSELFSCVPNPLTELHHKNQAYLSDQHLTLESIKVPLTHSPILDHLLNRWCRSCLALARWSCWSGASSLPFQHQKLDLTTEKEARPSVQASSHVEIHLTLLTMHFYGKDQILFRSMSSSLFGIE